MRDLFAAFIAVFLLLVAVSLAAALSMYRKRREASRGAARARGRTILAEVPSDTDLRLFSQDGTRFYYGEHSIAKDRIRAVRLLINGSPIAAYVSRRVPPANTPSAVSAEDRSEGLARDRWDVAIETADGTTLVECGAIREGISQELAQKIFETVKNDVEVRDGKS